MAHPTPGRTVLYRLSDEDARHITQSRAHNGINGNFVDGGQVYPAVVVRIFPGNPHGVANLQVLLDGPDSYWATSRHEGTEPGTYSWPERV